MCDRYWFFTWRTYGTWLPGRGGFVGYYHDRNGRRVIDNVPGEPTTDAIPPLERHAEQIMRGEPLFLTPLHAEALLRQFHETAGYRGWVIGAVAILVNHIHIAFGVPGDPDPSDVLRDWKAYGTRALNRTFGRPQAPRWWADGGSKEPLRGEQNWIGALCYTRDQTDPLLVWLSDDAKRLLARAGEPAASAVG